MSKIDKEKVELIITDELDKTVKCIKEINEEKMEKTEDSSLIGNLMIMKDISLITAFSMQVIERLKEEK